MAKRPPNREEREERSAGKERQARDQKILNDQLREADKLTQRILDNDNLSLENYADKLQLQAQLNENAKLQATILSKVQNLEGSSVKNAELLTQRYSVINDLIGKVSEKFTESVLNSSNIVSNSFETVDITQEYNDLLDEQYELDQLRSKLGKTEYERLTKMVDLAKEKLDTIKKTNESQEIANKLAKDYLDSNTLVGASTKGLLHSLESFKDMVGTGSLGVIGEVLGNKAGKYIEEIESDIQGKIVQAFQDSGESAITAFSVAKMAAGSFISFALPALGILGLLGIFGGLIHLAGHLDEELSEVGKSFGVSRKEAEDIHLSAKGIAKEMKIVGLNSAEVTESIKETSIALGGLDIMGRMNAGSDATKQLVKDVSVLSNTFGIADTESGGITAISDLAIIMGKSIGQVVKESVKLGKGLFTAKQSILTIGKISPNIAIAFKKGSVELLKAAQRAKLLGMELDDVADFGDKILDIETSLEAEMSARVITGRQLNFDMARQYALQGDIAGLQEEMLQQLGSMSEFQSMNRLQQKYMSEAFGMTVDEVSKLLVAQERLVELGIDQTKMDELQNMNAAQLAGEIKNTNNEKLKGYLQTLAKEKESAAINERISDAMSKIKEKIAGTLAPLLEQAHHFLDSAEGAKFLDKVTKIIETTLKAIVPVVQFLAENMWILGAALGAFVGVKAIQGIGGIISLFKGAGGAAAAAKPAVDAFGGAFGDLSKEMGMATNATNGLNQAVGTTGGAGGLGGFVSSLSTTAVNMAIVGVALIAFAGALWITAKAFQEFNDVNWNGAIVGAGAMVGLGLAALALTKISAGIVGTGGIIALYAVAAAIVAFGGSILMIGYGIKAATESIGILADGFKKLKNIGDLSSIGDLISNGLKSIITSLDMVDQSSEKFGKLKEAIEELGIDELVQFGNLAKVDLGKAADNIVAAINSFSKVTFGAIDFGKNKWFKSSTGLIGALEQLNKAVGELELDNIESLGKLASTDMSKLGENIEKGVKSLATINVGGAIGKLTGENGISSVFTALRDVFEDYNIFGSTYSNVGGMGKLAELDMKKLVDNSFMLKDVVWNLSQIGTMPSDGLTKLADKFTSLSNALDNLNVEKLKDLANINVENLRNLSAVFQEPVSVGGNTSSGGSQQSEDAKTNQKLDKVISVLENIFATSNQPVVIKIGDRTIETIGEKIQLMGSYGRTVSADGRVNKLRG